MARIRTIKPEFVQSETVGALSRDARLLFIQLWTIVDDEGRVRAASRMLASLLYPYDEDAPTLIDEWLDELEQIGCVRRYEVDGSRYLEVTHWLKHQKIDKPSRSKLPAFVEGSVTPREASRKVAPDLVPRTKDQDHKISPPSEARPSNEDADANLADDAVQIFNAAAVAVGWPEAQRLTRQRRAAVLARLRECGGIGGWRAAMDRARASAFLCGSTGWKADFDFFCQSKSFNKLMEGSYDDHKPTGSPTRNGKQSAHTTVLQSIARAVERRTGNPEREAGPDERIPDHPGPPPAIAAMADDLTIPGFLRRQ